MQSNRVIVIGGNACGPKAAARARRCDQAVGITIIEQGSDISTATCGLPYYISGVIPDQGSLLMRGAAYFKDVFDIDVMTGTRAVSIDRAARKVAIEDVKTGATSVLPYDKLVLATGSVPLIPKLDGVRLAGVFTLSTIADANAIKTHLARPVKKAVIIGAGLVGMEMAEALVFLGIEVTVIDMLDWLLPTLLDFEMAAYLEKLVKSKGVKLLFGQKVTGFEGDSTGMMRQVVTAGGALEADMVLLAIGRKPNSTLAKETGLATGTGGGIAVDRQMRTGDPAIYAGGDCVENISLVTGQKVLAPLGSTANKHGRVIGSNVTGGNEEFPGVLNTAIAKVFNYTVARTGLTEQEAGRLGYGVVTALVPGQERARYYPQTKDIIVKLVAEKYSGRLLGGQAVGAGDAAKRIDALAMALTFGATVDALANTDLAYAPPYNNAMDLLHSAANVIRNKQSGMAAAVTPMAVMEKIKKGEDFLLLDVRSEEEWQGSHIEAPRSMLIPLDALRKNLDKLPRDAEIVIYCHTSIRAYQAQRILTGAGFRNVKFMDGSITAWPYEITGERK